MALALDPSGNYLYVANNGSANVSTWGIGAGAALTADSTTGSPFSTGAATGPNINQPLSLAITSSGTYLYVGSNVSGTGGEGTVEGFTVAGGILTAISDSPYASGNEPFSIAIDSTQKFVYAPNVFEYVISTVAPLGSLGTPNYDGALANPYAVATYPGGTDLYLYITDNTANVVQAYSYSATTGIVAAIGPDSYNVGTAPEAIVIDPTGTYLYVSNTGSGTVSGFVITPGTGALTATPGSPYTASGASSANPTSIAIDSSGQFVYVGNADAGTVSQFAITLSGVNAGKLTKIAADVSAANVGGGPESVITQ
jgi:YVTN family beta-propeller protein